MTDTTILTRAAATVCIADALADRTAFVITAPPDHLAGLADGLEHVPVWTAYLDNGSDTVVATDNLAAFSIFVTLIPPGACVGVLTVPKTVPASVLSDVLGREVPDDGSRDVVILQSSGETVLWPLLFVDAIEQVDPAVAAQIRESAGLTPPT